MPIGISHAPDGVRDAYCGMPRRLLPQVRTMTGAKPAPTVVTHAGAPANASPLRAQECSESGQSPVGHTHRVLVSLVRSYITLVSSEWPAVCRRDPDFSVETAHNYGLGLIRMLAEFQVANGLDDRISVQLALELSEAKRQAERRVREPLPSTTEPKPSGARWRRGYRRPSAAARSASA